jgi:hypothetical protein
MSPLARKAAIFQRDIARYIAAFLARGEKTSDNIAAIYRWKYRWKYRSCVAGLSFLI